MNKWETGDEHKVANDCTWAEQYSGATIYLTQEIQSVIRKLCKDVKIEWQMMLTGTETKEGVYVTGYWIPKQEVSTASVINKDLIDNDVIAERKIVCGIHSHGSMGVFFSSTDEEFTNNSLIKNNIVVNNKGEMKACMRYETPCGLVHFFDADVEVETVVTDTIEGVDNIKETKWNYQPLCDRTVGTKKKGKKKHALLEDDAHWRHGYMGGMYE